jgi:thioredoxin reductase (NADPH)
MRPYGFRQYHCAEDIAAMSDPTTTPETIAFPRLDAAELESLRPLATRCAFEDGQEVFRAGDAELDLFVVESGGIEITNPSDGGRHVVTHGPGQFAGDIDLLTRRPVIVNGTARGRTEVLRVPGARLREMLSRIPKLSEKLLIAIQERRRLLSQSGAIGLKVVGPGKCADTMLVREFLFKNFVPFTWFDAASKEGQSLLSQWGSPRKSPVIEFSDGRRLINPVRANSQPPACGGPARPRRLTWPLSGPVPREDRGRLCGFEGFRRLF